MARSPSDWPKSAVPRTSAAGTSVWSSSSIGCPSTISGSESSAAEARAKLYAEAADLGKKRTAALRAAPNARATFDGIVLSILKTQGTKAGAKY